jgi:16S rRNA (guanine(966)-N(2))-methyltransferase RsmD
LRIVGGKYKGRKIEVSRNFDSRPTTDFAREALFNILNNHFDFELVKTLDLFSGTGSISLEMASRGCPEIDLVDINSFAIQNINKITTGLLINSIHTVRMDVFRFIPVCKKKYNIIFADPPYDLRKLHELPDLILSHNLLLDEGWFILEHGKDHSFKDNLRWRDERRYGNVHFSFFS